MNMQQKVMLYLPERESFTAGSLTARRVTTGDDVAKGRLEGDDLAVWREQQSKVQFVVKSYQTPIAWWSLDHGWHVVEQKFSATTSKQQNYVRAALRFAEQRGRI